MTSHIPRDTVEKFILRNKLRNTVNFLNYIRKPDHIKAFEDYVGRRGYTIPSPRYHRPAHSPSLLFHGAQRVSKCLIPSRKEKFVYATDDPNYAIFLSVINLKNASARVITERGKTNLSVDLAFVNGPSSLRNGWVHVVSGTGFKKTKNHEYVSKNPESVLFAIPVAPSDLTVPITVTLS